MKKLIAFLVVFALLAGSVFAVDLSGMVFGTVKLLEGDNEKDANDETHVRSGGVMDLFRLEGAGEVENFGGWIRLQGDRSAGFNGLAWWKPIDMLKVTIGVNPDGHWGKEGVTGWMFYQNAYDIGIAPQNNVWGDAGGGGLYGWNGITRSAFFGGYGERGLLLELTPMDMLAINIGIPFIARAGDTADVFLATTAQVALNLNFGTIGITFTGGGNKWDKKPVLGSVKEAAHWDYTTNPPQWVDETTVSKPEVDNWKKSYNGGDPAKIYAYFGLSAIENLGIDVGLGFGFPINDSEAKTVYSAPVAAGVGVKFDKDAFGVKFRAVADFGGQKKTEGIDPVKDPFRVTADLLPYFALNDNFTIFLGLGLGLGIPTDADKDRFKLAYNKDLKPYVGFHINPYIQVGPEWGPSFWLGFKLWATGKKWEDQADPDGKNHIRWDVPIALQISF